MSVLVQVRDVEEAVRDALKARAAREGVSLNAYLKSILAEAAARPSRAEVLERISARSERSIVSSVDLIRELRSDPAG